MPLDHTRAPLAEAVRAYRLEGTIPFTTPGHKRGRGLAAATAHDLGDDSFLNDIPVASGVDDTHTTRDVLGQAERLAADAFGARRSYFLLNGSSLGNQAALLATVQPGDEVVVARNVHKSIMAALILSGARPIYMRPCYDPDLEVAHGPDPADLAAALDAHPRARAVVVVSPTYYGVAGDVPALAALAHERGVPLLADEAWAPHFAFHPDLPPSAMQAGADLGVASIHKILTGFTQSAILNLQGQRIDAALVARWLDLLQTTSPSAFILASIDACRRQMALYGHDLLARTLALGDMARAWLNELPGVSVLGNEVVGRPGAAAIDRTKLVIDVRGAGWSGYDADGWLRERHHITVEMSDHRRIVALLSLADTEQSVGALLDALTELATTAHRQESAPFAVPRDIMGVDMHMDVESALTPAEAFHAPARHVSLKQATGEISADVVTPYPPGIPLLAPGERITRPIVEYLRAGRAAGLRVTGATDTTLATLRVVQS